jgi:hypothetical protein
MRAGLLLKDLLDAVELYSNSGTNGAKMESSLPGGIGRPDFATLRQHADPLRSRNLNSFSFRPRM